MAGGESKSSLSSNVLQMKFMRRSALRIEKEKSEEERQQEIDDEHWVLDLPPIDKKEEKYITEPSIERCENLVYGRMSFLGFNVEVEKLMAQHNERLKQEESARKEGETSVGDEEMAQRYQSLTNTFAKKFSTKRERKANDSSTHPNKKSNKHFMKPGED